MNHLEVYSNYAVLYYDNINELDRIRKQMDKILEQYRALSVMDLMDLIEEPCRNTDYRDFGWYRSTIQITIGFGKTAIIDGLTKLNKNNTITKVRIDNDLLNRYTPDSLCMPTKTMRYDNHILYESLMKKPQPCMDISKVKFNPPATIVFWKDGTKTVVKCNENDEFDPEKGLAMAITKKVYGNKYDYYEKIFFKHLPKEYRKKNKEKASNPIDEAVNAFKKLGEALNKEY